MREKAEKTEIVLAPDGCTTMVQQIQKAFSHIFLSKGGSHSNAGCFELLLLLPIINAQEHIHIS